MEDVESFSCLGEALVGGIGVFVLQCRMAGECNIAVARWERGYCAQIWWMVALRGTPSTL